MNTHTLPFGEYFKCEIIESPLLKGHEIAIKSGNKIYVWPDFNKPDELKILEMPDIDDITNDEQQLKFDVAFFGNGFYMENADGSKIRIHPREIHLTDFILERDSITEIAWDNIIDRKRHPRLR